MCQTSNTSSYLSDLTYNKKPGKVAIAQVDFNVHSATNVSHIFLIKNIIQSEIKNVFF